MERVRSGRTQLFREKDPNERSFLNEDNAEVILKHENPAVYAFLEEDGKWYWKNGCSQCNGKHRSEYCYLECDEHNVCRKCSIKRKDLKDIPWGGTDGWICKPCYDEEKSEERRLAFEKFNRECHSEVDFMWCDEIKCPHCGSEVSDDDIHESTNIDCCVCEGSFDVSVEYSKSYTMTICGERVTS